MTYRTKNERALDNQHAVVGALLMLVSAYEAANRGGTGTATSARRMLAAERRHEDALRKRVQADRDAEKRR